MPATTPAPAPAPTPGPSLRSAVRPVLPRAGAVLAAIAIGAPAAARPGPPDASVNKSGFTIFDPTPRALRRDMSTDRPDTTESPFTVDAGHLQLEMSLLDYTLDRRHAESRTAETVAVAPLLAKVGLLNNTDLQLGLDPYTTAETTDRESDAAETTDGIGDTTVRLKVNLWGNDGGPTAFAVMPFVKIPTAAEGLGNGNVEGGLIAPLAIALDGAWTLGLMAEVDLIRSAADDRYVVDLVHTATIGRPLAGALGGYVEYAGFVSLNGDEPYRAYVNAGVTYGLTPDVQLDGGVRLGLTEAAEDVGVFAGISLRF